MKFKINKAAWAKLSPELQAFYKADDAGEEYQLQVEGLDDTSALKTAKDHEVGEHKKTKAALAALKAQVTEVEAERDTFKALSENSTPKANLDALKKSWETEKTKLVAEHTEKLTKVRGALVEQLVDKTALSLASEVSTVPSLLVPVLRARLALNESDDGKFTTSVLDKEGKQSVLTIEDLRKEVLATPEYKSILKAGAGSGGSAPPKKSGGSASDGFDISKASPSEVTAHFKATNRVDLSGAGED